MLYISVDCRAVVCRSGGLSGQGRFGVNIAAGGAVVLCGGWVLSALCLKLFWFFLVCVAIKCELCRDIRKSVL